MANISTFSLVVPITGDNASTSCVISLGYTPATAMATAAYDATGNSALANISSVVPGTMNVTINFVAAFSGTIQVVLALSSSTYSTAQLQPVTGTITAVTAITNALPAGTNVIGHVIVDSGAITASIAAAQTLATVTTVSTVSAARIVGNAGAVLDAVITAATAPTNALATLTVNETTPPSLTAGQSVAVQSDYQGSVFVKPYRRGQTVSATGTFTSASATSFLAAQASGIFADLASLVLTFGEGATAAVYRSVNLSDGTKTYAFNFLSQSAVTTGFAQASPICITFDPPLPATSAATAWTIAMSSATDTPTCSAIGVFVLQKAS